MKKTIAVDIDDVLSATAEGFAAFSDKKWGGTHNPEQWQEAWDKFWDVPREEAIKRAEVFHNSDAVSGYRHYEQALPVLKRLKETHRLIVLTSRKVVLKGYTNAWLDKYFPDIFDEIHYAGIWDSDHSIDHKLNQSKAEICRQIGGDYLIDDQLKHCIAAANAGIEALLFGNYKWNQTDELPKDVTRVSDWGEVARYFNIDPKPW